MTSSHIHKQHCTVDNTTSFCGAEGSTHRKLLLIDFDDFYDTMATSNETCESCTRRIADRMRKYGVDDDVNRLFKHGPGLDDEQS